eukprot:TRINITY_DN17190_c0_g1_i1.p1 TRINITY_DN17190_c0_g1~~TRINITY_DN17190_c0_g1_i1.p1  ORF type:complete len:323 (+),score=81.96 TRINITY_DN17190_c0_g1_i1:70-1038(+)
MSTTALHRNSASPSNGSLARNRSASSSAMNRSSSAAAALPALSAAYNLRQFTEGGRGRLRQAGSPFEGVNRQPSRTPERRRPQPQSAFFRESSEEKFVENRRWDLAGGNGRWRKMRAWEDMRRESAVEVEKAQLHQKMREEKLLKKKQIREEMRIAAEEEEKRAFEKEQEELRRLEALERQREHDEEERLERQRRYEADCLRRLPNECEACEGTGACEVCEGGGLVMATYLAPNVAEGSPEFGRKPQGCTRCGGYRQGLSGIPRPGDGKCKRCAGAGLIWPMILSTPLQPPTPPDQLQRRLSKVLGVMSPKMSRPDWLIGTP